MTAIAFHFGAPDKVGYVCRLLRKAVGSGAKIWVVGDADVLQQIDSDLWAVSPTDFVVHCFSTAESAVQNQCRVVLSAAAQLPVVPADVLLNLLDEIPPGFEVFERVIEVVSTDSDDREWARHRWRGYTQLGYKISRHDLTLKS